jgi:hypothetical protein
MHIRMIFGDAPADVLQHDCLTTSRRSDDQGPLAFAQRRKQIDDAIG